ncbi:DUF6123 family protein [Caldibacillus lycopersici]|uniref:DUF6123 family protein n=1 Tax=Perspicuibacillus lycopersici TaxID=1325689 RepID=A0AAE3IU57_9BACI|nr:DUF6123 family protein [Perspicuibacillus lycopersici]MCU9613653.1 DUF6123 family protein [Perspicuibacillus lycopersici]
MKKIEQSVGEYIQYLQGKGFPFEEDAIGFIYFGMQYTNSPDCLAIAAIEITLKAQKRFDGSFYISLLEALKKENVTNREEAFRFVEDTLQLSL